jgi:hypothetical protein
MSAFVSGLLQFMGVDNLSGPWYGFWSGIGSDIGEVTLIGAATSLYWRHTCHAKRCWRIGRHPVEGTPHIVCRRHHPHDTPTAQQITAEAGNQESGR